MNTTSLPAALERARELAAPALREAVGRLDPDTWRVAAYHLGWVDEHGQPVGGSGGKWLRAALALLSAQAAGAPAGAGVPAAVAVELVHNFSLLHDDVMDGDERRRHRPTAWRVFGQAQAILAGDALLCLALEVLLACPPHGPRAAHRLACATRQLIAGQAEDLAFERHPRVPPEACLRMAGNKTGALLACAASLGAVLAGAPGGLVEPLHRFGWHLGLAFQVVDDLLGIWGRPEVTGKPAWSDLRQRKKTVPVVLALSGGGAAAGHLAGLLAGERPWTEEELELAARLVDEAGGRALAAAEAERQLNLALRHLDAASVPAPARNELAAVARFVTRREW